MKTKIFSLVALCLTLAMPANARKSAPVTPDRSIVILHENDVHCAIDGYTHLAGLRDAVGDTAYVALVSCGDFLQGGTAGAISRGQYIADIMRSVRYDAITLGNHEFDYPVSHSSRLLKHIDAPVVCANFYKVGKRNPVYAPYIIKRFGKTRVAFIGVVTPTALYTEAGAFMDGDRQIYELKPGNLYSLVQKAVDKVRKRGADYVVVISHLGEDDNVTHIQSHGLIEATHGIDILLDGHTHNVVPGDSVKNNLGKNIVVTQTGTKCNNIGKVLIGTDGRITNSLVSAAEFKNFTNARVTAVTDSIKQLLREQTQRVVCHSDVPLRILDENGRQEVRKAETNAGDIICDAYRVISGADIALANGGGIRTEKTAGDLTYGDIADVLPYDNNIWVVEATGATIMELLEKTTANLPLEDGYFPQVSGLRFTVSVADHKVSDVEVLSKASGEYEPLDLKRTYTVATIDYCVTGGGFYYVLKDCRVLSRADKLYRDVFVEYLEKNLGGHISNDYLEPQGRIKILK
ncbi:MAG: bifunctional metallophosphatase/5'-nucleotidase [Paludibacteraceae bacterium]|nr:bifunctional metallophosphatase/5'-nucleotidase [Paludibacteraceae bacterium]